MPSETRGTASSAATSVRSARRWWIGWELLLLVYIAAHLPRLLLGPIGIDLWAYKSAVDAAAAGHASQVYSPGGRFIYSPLALMVLMPLHWLEPRAGYVLLGLLSWTAVFFLFRTLLRGFELTEGRALVVTALTLLAIERYFVHAVNIGQVDILITLLLVWALVSALQSRSLPAIVCYALAIGFKLTPLVFIPYFLWRKQPRIAVGGPAVFLALDLASAFVLACAQWHAFLEGYVHRIQLLSQQSFEMNVSLMAVAARDGVNPYLSLAFFAAVYLAFHWFMSRRVSARPGNLGPRWFVQHATWWGWLMGFQLLASPITWFTHFPLLTVPVMVCGYALTETPLHATWAALFGLFVLHCWGGASRILGWLGVSGYPEDTMLNLILIGLVTLVASSRLVSPEADARTARARGTCSEAPS